MSAEDLEKLVREGAIERVAADRAAAGRDLNDAQAHLVDLDARVAFDSAGALTLAYDATRKAIVAHTRATGFRVTGGAGIHVRTGQYALAALDHLDVTDHLRAFDDLRRLRNRSEYGAVAVGEDAASEAVVRSRAIVEAIRMELGE